MFITYGDLERNFYSASWQNSTNNPPQPLKWWRKKPLSNLRSFRILFAKSESCLSCHCYPTTHHPKQPEQFCFLRQWRKSPSCHFSFSLLSLFSGVSFLGRSTCWLCIQIYIQHRRNFSLFLLCWSSPTGPLQSPDYGRVKIHEVASVSTRKSDTGLKQMLAFVVQLLALLSSRPFCSKDTVLNWVFVTLPLEMSHIYTLLWYKYLKMTKRPDNSL